MRRNQFAVANAPTASTPLSAERLHQAYVKNARSARTETPQGHPRVTHALLTKLRRLSGTLPASANRGTRGTALPESARRAQTESFSLKACAKHAPTVPAAMGQTKCPANRASTSLTPQIPGLFATSAPRAATVVRAPLRQYLPIASGKGGAMANSGCSSAPRDSLSRAKAAT